MNNFSQRTSVILALGLLVVYGCQGASDTGAQNIVMSSDTIGIECDCDSISLYDTAKIGNNDIPSGVTALMKAYPDFVKGFKDNHIIFADDTEMIYDDGQKKDFVLRLDNSDLEDMFFVPYVDDGKTPEYLADAGRSRCDEFFKKMYGSTSSDVYRNLENIDWFGSIISFTKINGASEHLRGVIAELSEYPELRKFLKCSGTVNWRKVRGANRMSAHSYGIAIDIAVDYSDYWLWKNPKAKETDHISYFNRIPRQIVEVFKKHGFIWGGAWYHYDTMHFEYRPEIIFFSYQ